MKDIEQDLELIFQLAMEKGNLSVALKAKEALAKRAGFFNKPEQGRINLDELDHDQLMDLLQQVENKLNNGQ